MPKASEGTDLAHVLGVARIAGATVLEGNTIHGEFSINSDMVCFPF